ncbi:PREDICTED: protein DPCD [Rhagoletis zephyria]|uniref:protein DPCD n=1 Tax=Rhagoletis zephyria TaxID=28612 RepID=UPI0008118B25|nr:PREDICTED: protein DPCD [Rhagoletis zephyria]XP_036336450.1 protein DPCD [Rhagoletis pomonella]
MSYENWLNYLRSAEKNSMISGRCRKVFYKFPDGQQMAEEYSMDTGIVQRRAWRKCKQLMGEPEWEIELGETPRQINQCAGGGDADNSAIANDFTLTESNSAPMLTKRITKKNIEWRIRNLPYPIEVYQVSADAEKRAIIVRTINKKYYKVITVPELDRCNLLPSQENISTHHQYNTLIITYSKPALLNEMEAEVLILLKEVETETDMEDLLQGLLAK